MKATISPSTIDGTITAPPGKSAMQRLCALALLNRGITTIKNPGESEDDLAALDIVQRLGGQVSNADGCVLINGIGKIIPQAVIDCGESGLSLRMFAPIAALAGKEVSFTGKGSLLKRPIDFFEEVFPRLGVSVSTSNGRLPLQIRGPLIPANITIDGSGSSQYLTGLLFAFAASTTNPVMIHVDNLVSKPYIDLSLELMEQFGYSIRQTEHHTFYIEPKQWQDADYTFRVEGDWSGTAFLLVAGAIGGKITVNGLNMQSVQADRSIIDVLKAIGAEIEINGERLTVVKKSKLKPFRYDATQSPDLFPPLVALAAYCEGKSVISGISRLKDKESNRFKSLQDVFGQMGIDIESEDDDMIIKGGNPPLSSVVESHHDHRIVMACAVAALHANGQVTINGVEAVNKSYPSFFEHLEMVGAHVSLQP